MPLSERRSSSRPGLAGLAALEAEAGAAGEQLGLVVGEQEHVGLDDLRWPSSPRPQDPQRHPRLVGGDREHDRRAVAGVLAELGGA